MINLVALSGRIVRSPELSKTKNGNSVCQFDLAVEKYNKVRKEKEAIFIKCIAWNLTAENIVKYLKKGSKISLSGSLNQRSYITKKGFKSNITEVIVEVVDFGDKNSYQSETSNQQYVENEDTEDDFKENSEDKLPF